MTAKDVSRYWQTTSQEALESADALFAAKRFDHALFFCHLAVEKLLKGLVYHKTREHPLPIHDLVKLAEQTTIPITRAKKEQLKEISTWNIEARYDTYKRDFYHKATKTFTLQWMVVTKDLSIWINNHY